MRWASGLLVVVLLSVAAIWALRRDPAPPPPLAPSSLPSDAAGHAERTGLEGQSAPRAAVADETSWLAHLVEGAPAPLVGAHDDDPEAVELRGRLTVRQRPWLHPAGIEVRLTRHWLDSVVPTEADADAVIPRAQEPVATTAADGTFAFRFRPVGGELFFLIDRGGAWMDYQKVQRVPLTGEGLDLGDVWLDDRGGIRGQVVQDGGKPMANVTVRAVDATLTALGSGLQDQHADRTRGLEHFAANGATRFGPLPDWVVRRDRLLPFPTTTSDAAGNFVLRGLRPGTHSLFFQHVDAHGSLRDVQVAALHPTEVGVVRLRAAEDLHLYFVDDHSLPWIGAEVAFVHDVPGFGSAPMRTDANGTVHARVANVAATRVVFAHPGGGPWLDLGLAPRVGPIVRVRRLPEITLSLADPLGVALPGGHVRFFVTGLQLRPVDRQLPAWMQPKERQPGLHVGLGHAGTVAVASVPGFAPAIAAVGPDQDNALSLLPLLRNTVRVWDHEHRAIAGATVYLQVHQHPDLPFRGAQWDLLANDRMRAGVTDENGALEVPVWATWFSVQATHPEFASAVGPRYLPAPGAVVDLTLPRRAGIHGTLQMQHRPAAAGFRVRARQQPPPGHRLEHSGFLAERLAVTAEDGSFAFRDLCAGIWDLQPELPATPSVLGAQRPASTFASMQVLLDEGQELHCVLEASRAALTTQQIAGVVRQNGAVVADALVRVRSIDRSRSRRLAAYGGREPRTGKAGPTEQVPAVPWQQHCTTDWFGDFDFGGLAYGTEHELRVDVPRGGRLQFLRRFVVRTPADANAAPVRLDIDLEVGSARLQCSHLGEASAGRMLRLRQVQDDGEEGACFELLTNEYGECLADDLPAGNWTVEPMHGGSLEPAEFTVRKGTITAVALEHRP